MEPLIKAQWLERLRSGTIEQGKQYLRCGEARCCLGVLCDLAVEAGVIPVPFHNTTDDTYCYGAAPTTERVADRASEEIHGSYRSLPVAVQKWAGFNDSVPPYRDNRYYRNLADDNDNRGMNFNEIADTIEWEF